MAWAALDKRDRKYVAEARRKIYELDARTIAYYRRNPCIAAEDLLGVRLIDYQKYILQRSWFATNSVWVLSRNAGKSFLGAVLMILKAVLYENQSIYIISSVGDQAKETFVKVEEIVLRMGRTSASIRSLKDIVAGETVKNPTNKTGFSHPTSGYEVSFYNGSSIYTLNSKPDSVRSRRATLVFFDEAAFCSDELLVVSEAFAAQEMDFSTSVDAGYDPLLSPRVCPTQLIYASSQDSTDKLFYRHYKNFAKKMIAGNMRYFVADMNCDVAISTFMDGEPYVPLLAQEKVDAAMKSNREKASREYLNIPTRDGGVNQAVKWATIRRSENFSLPILQGGGGERFILAFDPARANDNSIVGVMRIYEDEEMGLCGDIVNCFSMVDSATKGRHMMDSNRQLKRLRDTIIRYNGPHPDYEFIDSLLIDAGSGGGGVSTYADGLLNDWVDSYGKTHRGLIDTSHDLYKTYSAMYPNAVDKLKVVNPKRYRTQMFEELIELMGLGVIRFPYEYNGQDVLRVIDGADDEGEEKSRMYELGVDEMNALINIDLMKAEITSIHRYTNSENTAATYTLAKDKQLKMHDDRAYVLVLLAHRLHELRRSRIVSTEEPERFDDLPIFVTDFQF